MEYSRRAIEIVEILLNHDTYVGIQDIASELKVSRRTVFREMDAVEAMVTELKMALSKKQKQGLKLLASAEQREHFISAYARKADAHFDQDMRQRILIVELLKSREPQKFYYFSNMLSVSEATISYDMDKIEPWFNAREITLVRKPGFGVYLEGSETQFRKAIVDFLYENYEHQELVLLMETGLNQENMVESLIDREVLIRVTQLLKQHEDMIAHRLTDAAYMGLLIHLSIAIQRTLRGERIFMNPELLEALKRDSHFDVALMIGEQIKTHFNISFPEDELGYITMHLKGSKLKTTAIADENDVVISNFQMSRMASKMIGLFKRETGYDLKDDERLLVGLVTHLRPAITRMKMKLDIRNPLLDKIKEMYPEIFAMSEKAAKLLEKEFEIQVPEAEIGYLAMHFGAAIERVRKAQIISREIRVGVVCSSGIGTSSLLYSRLSKLFPKLNIVAQFSKEDVLLGKTDVYALELLVSTISLEVRHIPVVTVNPLVLEDDEARIRQIVSILNSRPPVEMEIATPLSDADKIMWLHDITESVLTVEKQFALKTDIAAKSQSQLIKKIVDTYASDFRSRRKLEKQFEAREKLGSTVVHDEGILLLHTRSDVFDKPLFNIWRLSEKLKLDNGESVESILVMGLPENQVKVQTELMSQLSRAIVDDEAFITQIHQGDEASIKAYMSRILHKWLNRQLREGGHYDL